MAELLPLGMKLEEYSNLVERIQSPEFSSNEFLPQWTWLPPQYFKSCLGPLEVVKSSYYASLSGFSEQSPKGDDRWHAGTVQEQKGGQTL